MIGAFLSLITFRESMVAKSSSYLVANTAAIEENGPTGVHPDMQSKFPQIDQLRHHSMINNIITPENNQQDHKFTLAQAHTYNQYRHSVRRAKSAFAAATQPELTLLDWVAGQLFMGGTRVYNLAESQSESSRTRNSALCAVWSNACELTHWQPIRDDVGQPSRLSPFDLLHSSVLAVESDCSAIELIRDSFVCGNPTIDFEKDVLCNSTAIHRRRKTT
ncbi:hypothetical protein BD410DRAFT_804160 [Rickenella mellea]|uniref:Uncharacterized protein n=1 Tax=Rickenella mellea TaxID=50990 RepID=A0A4Y7Q2E5_9AGAM|nr:hypothetical protein BD410DRAFT_804160 [Rickenella mellea]